jgi:hypothetical protein
VNTLLAGLVLAHPPLTKRLLLILRLAYAEPVQIGVVALTLFDLRRRGKVIVVCKLPR